jgi:hypothetical protein
MPRTNASLERLLNTIRISTISDSEIVIIHSSDWDQQANLSGLNIRLVNSGYLSDAYEFPALHQMWLESQSEDFYGLYLHCKGASKTDNQEYANAIAWCDFMLYGLVTHADQCLHHLNSGAELVGSMWYWHFKGNFYWFQSQYIRQLVDPALMDKGYRQNCEHWCSYPFWWGRYRLPKVKNLFYMNPICADNEFLERNQRGYLPSFNQKRTLSSSFVDCVNNGHYCAFDTIYINSAELDQFRHLICKFINYDATVINTDTQEVYKADIFF